jgi:hypothetical protein
MMWLRLPVGIMVILPYNITLSGTFLTDSSFWNCIMFLTIDFVSDITLMKMRSTGGNSE